VIKVVKIMFSSKFTESNISSKILTTYRYEYGIMYLYF